MLFGTRHSKKWSEDGGWAVHHSDQSFLDRTIEGNDLVIVSGVCWILIFFSQFEHDSRMRAENRFLTRHHSIDMRKHNRFFAAMHRIDHGARSMFDYFEVPDEVKMRDGSGDSKSSCFSDGKDSSDRLDTEGEALIEAR